MRRNASKAFVSVGIGISVLVIVIVVTVSRPPATSTEQFTRSLLASIVFSNVSSADQGKQLPAERSPRQYPREDLRIQTPQFFAARPLDPKKQRELELMKVAREDNSTGRWLRDLRWVCAPTGQSAQEMYDAPEASEWEQHSVGMRSYWPRLRAPTNPSRTDIPRKIILTNFKDIVPTGMYRNLMRLRKMNPEFEVFHYSDKTAREYIVQHTTNRSVITAFDLLIPGAFKADLFRYFILFREGGVYIDADQVVEVPFTNLLNETKIDFLSAEDNNSSSIYNALIAIVPHHPLMSAAMDRVIYNVLARNHTDDILRITGPKMFGDVYAELESAMPVAGTLRNTRLLPHLREAECSIGTIDVDLVKGSKPAMWTRYPEYKTEMKWFRKQTHYWVLWTKKKVFSFNTDAKNAFSASADSCPDDAFADEAQMSGAVPYVPLMERSLHAIAPFHRRQYHFRHFEGILENVSVPMTEVRIEFPMTIVQMHASDLVPASVHSNIRRVIELNPEFDHRYFSLQRARKYIDKHCGQMAADAFDATTSGPIRADLLKYCFLWSHGGVWMDASVVASEGIRNVVYVPTHRMHRDGFVHFTAGLDPLSNKVDPVVVGARAGNRVVERALGHTVDLVNSGRWRSAHRDARQTILTTAIADVTRRPFDASRFFDEPIRAAGIGLIRYHREAACRFGFVSPQMPQLGTPTKEGRAGLTSSLQTSSVDYVRDMSWYNPDGALTSE